MTSSLGGHKMDACGAGRPGLWVRRYHGELFLALALVAGCSWAEERKVAAIDWDAARAAAEKDAKIDKKGLSGFRAAQIDEQKLRTVVLPVLVAGTGPVRAAPLVRGQKLSYSSSYAINGAKIVILGSATNLVAPEALAVREHIDSNLRDFEVTEDGADLNFMRFGANYILRISCERPEDERCTKRDFLSKLKRSLIVVGGEQSMESPTGGSHEGH